MAGFSYHHRSVSAVARIGIVAIALGVVLSHRITVDSFQSAPTLLSLVAMAGEAAAQPGSNQVSELTATAAIGRINYYRRLINLQEVSEDETMSAAARKQAESQLGKPRPAGLANAAVSSGAGTLPAIMVMSRNQYGPDGGGNPSTGLLISGINASVDGGVLIDRMMAMPFAALRLIDPQLVRVGFGAQCEPGVCSAVISIRRGLDKSARLDLYESSESDRFWNPMLGPFPATRGQLKTPFEFPPDGGKMPLLAYSGGDWPSSLATCQYATPTGPPIILELGSGVSKDVDPEVTKNSLTRDGQPVDHCLVQASSFASDHEDEKSAGHRDLSAFGVVIIIPRQPLSPSGTYAVSITADSKDYSWSLRTGTSYSNARTGPADNHPSVP